MLSLIDFTLNGVSFMMSGRVKLSKMAFMALEDIVWGAAFSGHWSSSFSLKTSKIVSSTGITGTALSTFSASSSERRSSLIQLKTSATVLFLPFRYSREKSYFTSSFIHLCRWIGLKMFDGPFHGQNSSFVLW